MIVKVCGIKSEENILFLSQTNIDMIGLNFYEPSVRYVSDEVSIKLFKSLPSSIKRVGVFVNEAPSVISSKVAKYNLDYIQLHGDESPEYCSLLAQKIDIIKVFRIDNNFDFTLLDIFNTATYFLFDTKTITYGGSGNKFDWSLLKTYKESTPFLLSGGIGPNDVDDILNIEHPNFAGVDINSKFESAPGIKDKNLVLPFINKLKVR
jgi:phosphoribosylanthranilate isomerase